MTSSTTTSTAVAIEEPSRDELVRIFAKRYPSVTFEAVGKLFDEYLNAATSISAATS